MFSWLGIGGNKKQTKHDEDTQPLLPEHSDAETELQSKVYDKLHTYLMLRAIAAGYLPSTEQAIAHLRTLLSADVLNPTNTALTPSGRKLVRDTRRMIQAAITLLRKKCGDDQLQEFLWCTSRARAGFDGSELADTLSTSIGAATNPGVMTGYDAVRTVADLLMTNAEFRRMCGDLATLGRQVLADTAEASADVAVTVGETVKPSERELASVGSKVPVEAEESSLHGGGDEGETVKDVAEVLVEGVQETAGAAIDSAARELNEDGRGDALLERMKRAVLRLRGRTDYTESVNIISILLKRYAIAYSRSISGPAGALGNTFDTNNELDMAVKRFWQLVTSFGDGSEWNELTSRWNKLLSHLTSDKEFETLMNEIGNTVQDILTVPSMADADVIQKKLQDIQSLVSSMGTGTDARSDIDRLLEQSQIVFASVLADSDIVALLTISRAVLANLWPTPYTLNPDLASDLTHVLLPLLLSLIQYIPILRLTVATPEIDLLLENLILEPGDTFNHTSFFPHTLALNTTNDFSLSKGRPRARYTSSVTSLATISLNGLAVRADDVGYWLKAHTGPWRFWDEGIVSVLLDGKGVDIALDLEFGRERIENLIALRDTHVKIHKLDYTLSKSRFRWLAWPFKPILKPILKRVLRKQIEAQVKILCHFLNRELIFARERLRATRIAQPKGLWRFIRAVAARLGGSPSEDIDIAVGISTRKDEPKVFEGKYAPGSIVKVWEEHGETVGEIVDVKAEGAWRNGCFDLKV